MHAYHLRHPLAKVPWSLVTGARLLRIFWKGMILSFRAVHPLEIFVTFAIVSFLNFYYSGHDLLFTGFFFSPYTFFILLFSSFYGKKTGLVSVVIAVKVFLVFFAVHEYEYLLGKNLFEKVYFFISALQQVFVLNQKRDSLLIYLQKFVIFNIFFAILIGEMRDYLGNIIRQLKEERKNLKERNRKIEKNIHALSLVNDEYQSRILGQEDSIMSVYSTLMEFRFMTVDKIIHNVLNAIAQFTGAKKISFWRYYGDHRNLELLASHGWDEQEMSKRELHPKYSLHGWVARNNSLFSMRMLLKYPSLKPKDKGDSIVTVPVIVYDQVWGIINIEVMPFLKYYKYSEQIITMTANFISPLLQHALQYEEITKNSQENANTGLFGFQDFENALGFSFDQARKLNNHLSLILVEIVAYADLEKKYGESATEKVIEDLSKYSHNLSQTAIVYAYKNQSQFAILLPNLDYDGALLFCQNFQEYTKHKRYALGEDSVDIDIFFGFSSLSHNHRSYNDLIELSEKLLFLQKSVANEIFENF